MIIRCALLASLVIFINLPSAGAAEDPQWSVDHTKLDAALECPATFEHPEHEPVLLVHGTFTAGQEQFSWNYSLLLAARGYDVCLVTYPDRGLGDLQESAEYVAHAILAINQHTGQMVDVMGHSQGGLLPRWAIKFWPSVLAVVDDAVLVAPPSHGTEVAPSAGSPIAMPAAFFQMSTTSQFIAALNAGDETPGDVDWSVLYTEQDELVRPVDPVPTAALDWGHQEPHVRNLRLQELCPGRLVDHVTIGTTDRLTQDLVLDAFDHPGPVDPGRLGPLGAECALPDQYLNPAQLSAMLAQMQASMSGGFPDFHSTSTEPPLKPYASAALAAPSVDRSIGAGPDAGRHAAGPGAAPLPSTALRTRLADTGLPVPTSLAAALLLAAFGLHRLRAAADNRRT